MFDGVMFRIFGDIPQDMNQCDGLILGEKDQEEHDMTLQKDRIHLWTLLYRTRPETRP